MRKLLSRGLMLVALLFFSNATRAQDKATQAAILQKLNEIDNQLNEMDKRFEIRFTKLEERFNTIDERFKTVEEKFNRLEDKIAGVNTRIDDKFNLMVGLLGLIVALLALPYMPKLFERFKARPPDSKETLQRLQEQIDQLKAQLSQRIGPTL